MTSPFSGHESTHLPHAEPQGSTELRFYYDDPGGAGETAVGGAADVEPIVDDADELVTVAATDDSRVEDLSSADDAVEQLGEEQGDQEDELSAYDLIVEAIAGTIDPHTDKEIAKIRAGFIERAGYNAKRTAFAEPIRHELAGYARQGADGILNETRDIWMIDRAENADDVFSRTFRRVAKDSLGEKPGGGLEAPVDSTYFDPGSEIREAIENGDLDTDDLEVQGKLVIATSLLTSYGLYKMNAWGGSHPATLMEGLQLMETCAALIPKFNPDRNGYELTERHLMNTTAAIQADNFTKPNYQFSRPQMGPVLQDVRKALHALHRVEAVKLANNYQLEELVGEERAAEIMQTLAERERQTEEEQLHAA